MAINEEALSRARSAQGRQDSSHPFLIHTGDGRLFPNVQRLRERDKNLVIYHGDAKASLAERMKYLNSGRRAVFSAPPVEAEPFNVGTATREELIDFAATEYGVKLDQRLGLPAMRGKVAQLAGVASDGDPEALS